MLFMCFSLLYIDFYEEETAETLGTLPDYPELQSGQDLFLILGELHNQIELLPPHTRKAEHPRERTLHGDRSFGRHRFWKDASPEHVRSRRITLHQEFVDQNFLL
jgi:hypothetical protein